MLRPIERVDVPALTSLVKNIMPDPWRQQTFEDCFKDQYYGWVVENAVIQGFIIILIQLSECQIMNMAVHRDFQRQGVGKHLLHQAMECAQSLKVEKIFLEVRQSNQAAIMLYEKMGFKHLHTRKNYYPLGNQFEDAYVMVCELSAG